jgi:hypothetical protein
MACTFLSWQGRLSIGRRTVHDLIQFARLPVGILTCHPMGSPETTGSMVDGKAVPWKYHLSSGWLYYLGSLVQSLVAVGGRIT